MNPAQLAQDLAVVRKARLLFSHHSVGGNLLAGLAALDREAGGGGALAVVTLDKAPPEGPAFAHVSGGRNQDPRSKIDFWVQTVRALRGFHPDLAFMKLCYVDFNPSTDVDALFEHYRAGIETLRRERPDVRLAHVTVPLYARPSGLKDRLDRLLGRQVWEDATNVKRAVFNRKLVEAFAGDPIFDLAAAEATAPDGARTTFELGGATWQSLYPGYTEDGGHLNELGRRQVGAAAARFLAAALAPGR